MHRPHSTCLGPLLLTLLASPLHAAQEQTMRPRAKAQAAPQDSTEALLSKAANEAHWIERLTAPDLMQRQASYDLLLLRAKLDPSVEGFLSRLALDERRPELAWTARLGLRELDLRQKLELSQSANPEELMAGPYGSDQRLQAVLRQLVIEYPSWQFGIQDLRTKQAGSAPSGVNPGQPQQGAPRGGSPPQAGAEQASPQEERQVRVRTDVLGIYVRRAAPGSKPAPGQRPGLVVALIEPGSIAQRMDLAVGDVLLRINGQDMYLPEDITKVMKARAKNQAIQVEWIDRSQIKQTATWTPSRPPGRAPRRLSGGR